METRLNRIHEGIYIGQLIPLPRPTIVRNFDDLLTREPDHINMLNRQGCALRQKLTVGKE